LKFYQGKTDYSFSRFGIKEDCDRILQSGSLLFDGIDNSKTMVRGYRIGKRSLISCTCWIRFPSLHLKLWSQTIISKLACLVGTPLFMDKATATRERLSYAQCFVNRCFKEIAKYYLYRNRRGCAV